MRAWDWNVGGFEESLLNQTVALRGVMLLSGGNGVGKSSLVGRWVRQLETRLYTPVNLTQATLSSSGLLAPRSRSLGKRASRQALRGTPAVARTSRSTAAASKTQERLMPTASNAVLR